MAPVLPWRYEDEGEFVRRVPIKKKSLFARLWEVLKK